MAAKAGASLPRLHLPDRAAWRAWLAQNHDESSGIWLAISKKGHRGLTYDEAVEEALCFGWIDSKVNAVDDKHFVQMMTPRKPGGTWSESNRRRVERLMAEGRMTEAGLRVIERAKADGSWDMLNSVERLEVPEDLAQALKANAEAAANFAAFAPSVKKQLLYWLHSAKRPETRDYRLQRIVALSAKAPLPTGADLATELRNIATRE